MSEINDGGSTYSELKIALPQIPHEFLLTAQVSIEDILAVQSLAMGFLRMRARTQRRNPQLKRYGFVMLDKGGLDEADVYDGSTDTYMGCFVQKVHPDQWHMLVSFLDTTNTEATKAQNTRRMYIFDWLRSGKHGTPKYFVSTKAPDKQCRCLPHTQSARLQS